MGTTFKVRLMRVGARVHGELSVTAAGGDRSARRVDGESCTEVVGVLSLTVALSLDPAAGYRANPVVSGPPLSGAPTAALPPSALPSPPASPGSAPPASTSPSPTTQVASPPVASPSPAVSAARPPAQPVPSPTGSVAEPSAPPAGSPPSTESAIATAQVETPRPPDDQPPRATRVNLGARALVAHVVSPYVSLGGALSLVVTSRRSEEVPPALGIALLHAPNDFLVPSPDVVVRWTALALTACPPLGFAGRVQIQPCVLGMGGWLTATERAVANPLSVGRAWWSAGAVLRTTIPVGGGFSIDLDVGATVPVVKRRFIVTSPDSTVGETPSISAVAGIGVSRSL